MRFKGFLLERPDRCANLGCRTIAVGFGNRG